MLGSPVDDAVEAVPLVSDYEARLVAGKCTRPGCDRKPAEDSGMCKQHTRIYRKLDRDSKKRKRAARKAAGLCIWCTGDKPSKATPPSPTCLACRVKHRKVRKSDGVVPLDVYLKQRENEIAAATREHEDGRVRYHGQQKRGQQPKAQLNVQDLVHVQQDFDGFAAGVMVLAGPEVEQMHRSDLTKIEQATARLGDRAARRMDDILERLGHFKERHGRRDGE